MQYHGKMGGRGEVEGIENVPRGGPAATDSEKRTIGDRSATFCNNVSMIKMYDGRARLTAMRSIATATRRYGMSSTADNPPRPLAIVPAAVLACRVYDSSTVPAFAAEMSSSQAVSVATNFRSAPATAMTTVSSTAVRKGGRVRSVGE